MFTENLINPASRSGWIEVIVGSMFSGKTEELIRRLNRAKIANQRIEIFKPKIDHRYSKDKIVSHNDSSIHSIPVDLAENIIELSVNTDVVGIDEAQFFDNKLTMVCNQLANKGIRVIVAGLDMDFQGNPFGPMPQLLSTAEYITKVHAICMQCGNPAQYTHRKTGESNQIVIGEKDIYEPLCRNCYLKALNH